MAERTEWQRDLLAWYRRAGRDLPWRRTRDPYAIWVSEVMLQQTQVAAVLPYYERWMREFPTVEALAMATEAQVLRNWQGLGYYRRARLLRQGAEWVLKNGWPRTAAEWLRAPGVGPYTAAAIASIAGGQPEAVVDGNVERVFARFRGNPSSEAALLKAARRWAHDVLDPEFAGDWNQAVMELGATICRPRNPRCGECPVEAHCVARQTWSVDQFPRTVPAPPEVRQRHVIWVPYFEKRFGLRQIPEGAWWSGLWEFPRSVDPQDDEELRGIVGEGWIEALGQFRHTVTRHKILAEAWLVRCESARPQLDWKPIEELSGLPMPSPQRRVADLAKKALGIAG